MDWRIAGNAGTVVEPIGVALKPSCGCRAQPPVRTPGAGTGQREQCRYRHGATTYRFGKTFGENGAGCRCIRYGQQWQRFSLLPSQPLAGAGLGRGGGGAPMRFVPGGGVTARRKGVKDVLAPQGMFEDLGIKYIGPVDGHDLAAMEFALRRAKDFGGPVIVHAITEKGRGYTPAEEHVADRFHAVGVIHPETGLPVAPSRFGWTAVFAEEIVQIARQRSDIVGVTAAMLAPVGLAPMAEEFPDRVVDVGIAEQHGLTSAAAMAFAGLHPVVALYATFLNRAYDQLLMDVALHRAGVTIVLDRAGITGDDGASHNGMWDLALLRTVPGLRLAAPRDEPTMRAALREAVAVDDAPTVVRYPKGALPEPLPAIGQEGSLDVLSRPVGDGGPRVLAVGVGAMAHCAVAASEESGRASGR